MIEQWLRIRYPRGAMWRNGPQTWPWCRYL